ncbi:YbhB/YbcL family Raf kinase inhibitor-like protein [Patescibacteria group bacterium]
MQISSPAFGPKGAIPAKYTCDGENINPELNFHEIPEGAQSLALVVDDPDAPAGTWDHWLVYNIPPDSSGIDEGRPNIGKQGKTSFGNNKYGGPCPPDGEHRYFFKLYALDVMLELDPDDATKDGLLAAMEGHILEETELVGKYDRSL